MHLQSAWVLRGNCSSEMFVELPHSVVLFSCCGGGFFGVCVCFLFCFPLCLLVLVESMIFVFFSLKIKH